MSDELLFSLRLYALFILITILYGCLQWRWNLWVRESILHMPLAPCAIRLATLVGQGKAPAKNLLTQAYEKFCDSHIPFCGLGFYRWRQPAVLNFDYQLERLVLKPEFDYYADGGTSKKTLHNYWLRRHFYLPRDGWGELRGKLTTAFLKGDFTALTPQVWKLAENELIQAIDVTLAKNKCDSLSLFDLQNIFFRYIVDVTAKCLFNLHPSALNASDEDVEYQELYAQLLVLLRKHKPMDNIWQQYLPIGWLDYWHKHQLQMCTYTFCNKQLPQLLTQDRRNDVFHLLCTLNTTNSKLNITNASIKTTTNTLLLFVRALARSLANMTLTIYELARHQDTQTELRTEIVTQYNKRYEFGALRDREVLEHVISETQRSYCTSPRCLLGEVSENCITYRPGYELHKGTAFIVALQDNCYHNVLYPNPSEWDADRFAVVELMDSMNQLIRTYCGQREKTDLDELQTSIGIMSLLRHFKFTLSKNEDSALKYDDTVPILLLQQAPNVQVTRM